MLSAAGRAALARSAGAGTLDLTALTPYLDGMAPRMVHAACAAPALGDMVALAWDSDGHPAVAVTTRFLGLTGAVSPLPQETLHALEAALGGPGGAGLGAWLDHLHHRLLTLHVRALSNGRPSRAFRSDFADPWSRRLLAATAHAEGLVSAADRHRLLPALTGPASPAHAVRWAIATWLSRIGKEVPVAVQPLQGGPKERPQDALWRLGSRPQALGADTALGRFAHAAAARAVVRVGPVCRAWLDALAPAAAEHARGLRGLMKALLPAGVTAEVVVALAPAAARPWALGGGGHGCSDGLTGLGRATFLGAPGTAPHAFVWLSEAPHLGRIEEA